ncbi:tyrosine-type recombinase/integrase [Paenibacillus sp. MCAF9]|uniref:tyrosine-type recombinase/integrase n=1 Tax=Paenibacillus sp. MCAF9 TaxID=3233046 RepID=UPI003F9441B4
MAGSILKIGKKHRVTLELGMNEKGKRERDYKTFDTLKEAEEYLNEFKYNKQRNMIVQLKDMTTAEFMEHWLENYVKYRCEETTIYGYSNIIRNHFVPYFGNIKLRDLLTPHIQRYYNKYLMDEKKLSPITVHKHHAVISNALKFATEQELVYRNVATAVSLPKIKKKFKGKSYTREQLNTLLDAVVNTNLELPVYLGVFLGLRRSEIAGLKWKFVDLNRMVLNIEKVRTSAGKRVIEKDPKSEESKRGLGIEDRLLEVLLKHKDRQGYFKGLLGKDYHDSDYVWTRDDGKPYRVNTLSDQFKVFLRKHEFPPIRFHDLRHTYCSILFDEGVRIDIISELLGHSTIETTRRIYKHKLSETPKTPANVMANALMR